MVHLFKCLLLLLVEVLHSSISTSILILLIKSRYFSTFSSACHWLTNSRSTDGRNSPEQEQARNVWRNTSLPFFKSGRFMPRTGWVCGVVFFWSPVGITDIYTSVEKRILCLLLSGVGMVSSCRKYRRTWTWKEKGIGKNKALLIHCHAGCFTAGRRDCMALHRNFFALTSLILCIISGGILKTPMLWRHFSASRIASVDVPLCWKNLIYDLLSLNKGSTKQHDELTQPPGSSSCLHCFKKAARAKEIWI